MNRREGGKPDESDTNMRPLLCAHSVGVKVDLTVMVDLFGGRTRSTNGPSFSDKEDEDPGEDTEDECEGLE